MSRLSAVVMFWPLVATVPATAGDAEVKAIVEKAVKAMGGEAALKRAGAYTYLGRVTVVGPSDGSVTRVTAQGCDRVRDEFFAKGPVVEKDSTGEVRVLDRDQGWVVSRGQSNDLLPIQIASRRLIAAFDAAPFNLAPLRDGKSVLETDGEKMIDGRPAVGIKVSRPEGTFTVFFDRESGLPVEGVRTFDRRDGGATVVSVAYRDYQVVGGLKVASRLISTADLVGVRKSMSVVDVVDFKVLDEVDPKLFARPE